MAVTTPAPEEPSRRLSERAIDAMSLLGIITVFCLTVVVAIVSTGDDSSSEAPDGPPSSAHVGLSEFAIEPSDVAVAQGGTLHVENTGSAVHNLAVTDTDLATPDIAAGDSAELDVSSLAAGRYQLACLIAGHADAGMEGTLEITAGGATGGSDPADDMGGMDHGDMDYAAMEQAMVDTMAQFPAETAGVGNPILEPTEVEADGTKVFDLVAQIADWERAPGDVVQAWTYNGVVPAPSIQLDVGDRAKFRLTNELPIATDLHLHGLNVDNRFDGVAPVTQPVVETGETFVYEYTADEVSVAMYHPHFHSQIGLPNGMFGSIFVGRVPIPAGRTVSGEVIPADVEIAQELPMVLNDAGVIGYSLNGKSFPATAPIVADAGDWVLFHYFNEGTQIHPMHLHQFDQVVIAKDGFPIDVPYAADVVNVAPGERYSVLVQLDEPGTWVWHCHILPHVEGEDGMFGMVTAVVVQ